MFFLLFIILWLVITAIVIAVHFWFLSAPVLAASGVFAVRRQRRRRQLERHQPGPRDPWLNEVLVELSELGFEERERNFTPSYHGVPVEGYIELQRERLSVDVVIFAHHTLARNAEFAMRADAAVRTELHRAAAEIRNLGRVLLFARTRLGVVDEFDFDEVTRVVSRIAPPPPIASRTPVVSTHVSVATPTAFAPAGARTITTTLPPAAPHDTIEQLRQLGQLRDSGVLTEDEFAAKKAELLQRI